MKTPIPVASFLSLAGVTGCVSEKAAHSPQALLLQDAEQYASDLKSHDKLPGYSSSEHGRVIVSTRWKGGEVDYPASVTVRATKRGDKTVYRYELIKNSPEATWDLTEATHLDKHSKLIDQLYPK